MYHVIFFAGIYPTSHLAKLWHKILFKWWPCTDQDLGEVRTQILGPVGISQVERLKRRTNKSGKTGKA